MMPEFVLASTARPTRTIVDLLDRTVTDSGIGQTRLAGMRVNVDGTFDVYDSDTGWVFSYNWITPTAQASGLYEFRISNVLFSQGSAFFIEDFVENVWRSCTGNPEMMVRDNDSSGSENVSVGFDLAVRLDGGSIIDTASVNLAAIWDIT